MEERCGLKPKQPHCRMWIGFGREKGKERGLKRRWRKAREGRKKIVW